MKKSFLLILLFYGLMGISYAQIAIEGSVQSSTGDPLPGVNVIIKGTTQGTITDVNGNYVIPDIPPDGVLLFSFIGMVSQEISVNDQTVINITMQEDLLGLDEVVVIGYGTVTKRDLTGAVSSVKSEEITMAPVQNTLEAIQGRVAGLDIARGDGRAGTEPEILLRGSRSIKKDERTEKYGDEPIYIIDGIQGSIGNLNPNDIVSIDVLKDASSTAIYGASGANGVIMITTRKAEKGKTQVDFDYYTSINSNPSFPSPLQGQAWLDYLKEGYLASGGSDTADRSTILSAWGIPDTINQYIDNSKWINWVDESFRTGIQHNANLSILAGSDKVQSSFSIGYNKTEGIYKNDYLDKITLRENLNIQAADWIKTGIIAGLTYRNRESRSSRVNKSFDMIPLGDVYDEDGDINQFPIAGMTDVISPLNDNIDGTFRDNKKSIDITANPYIEITPLEGLSFRSIFGTSLSADRQGIYSSDHTYMMLAGSTPEMENARYRTNLGYDYTWENILDYKITIADNHNIGATFITSYSKNHDEETESYSENFTYEEFLFFNLDAGINPYVTTYYEEKKRLSYAGRLNYNFMGKYFITGSVRYDGVSQLTETWDAFPSGAIAWRISDESFMDWSKNWLNNLKLRAGYGVAGSYNIGPYSTLLEVTNGKDAINLGSGELLTIVPSKSLSNPKLGWEKTYSLNIGLDFGLLHGRIDGTVEWYDQDSRHLIFDRDLPFSNGGFLPKEAYTLAGNIATMSNKGIELTLNTRNIRTKDFQWNSTLTFSRNWNEITSIDLGSGTTPEQLISLDLFIGEPRDVFYSYNKTGIWQASDTSDAAVFGLLPGDVKVASSLTKESDGEWYGTVTGSDGNDSTVYYTADNPYTINANDDRQILGQEKPKWVAGFQNTFIYKGFDLNIFMTARWGHMIQAELLGYFDHGELNILDNYDYWTETNPTNDYPRPWRRRSAGESQPLGGDALMYVDASYVKVKNITLGYTLPQSLLERIFISNLRIYSTVYNSLIFTKSHLLKGTDPETGASDSFPLYKQLVFGVKASF